MTRSATRTVRPEPSASPDRTPPYADLYIYYLRGCPGDARGAFTGDGFIGNWQEEETAFLFFDRPALHRVEGMVKGSPHLELLDHFHMSYEDWQGGRLATFREGRFAVVPAWEAAGGDGQEAFTLRLDPGVVFGAGTHPTTRDCLSLLDTLFQRERIETALDLGTGTGLLALGSACLGCRRTLAVDFNLLSVRTARENIRINGFESAAWAVQGRAECLIDCRADLLIANLHYDVMKDLIGSPSFLEKRWFILSGLLRSEAAAVEAMLARRPVEILEKRTRDTIWSTYLGMTPDAVRGNDRRDGV
jgi:ribosomal protein L11 methyltransferase